MTRRDFLLAVGVVARDARGARGLPLAAHTAPRLYSVRTRHHPVPLLSHIRTDVLLCSLFSFLLVPQEDPAALSPAAG